MDTEEFIRRILPDVGQYAVAIIRNKRVIHKFYNDTKAMADAIIATGGKPQPFDVYFAIASFGPDQSRTQANVVAIKALFADVDCGPDKLYADWKAGLHALLAYIQASGMPMPMVVFSGRGLHLYWVLTKSLTKDEWQPLADALKASFGKHGFAADPAVTADAARILRPIGTYNSKNGAQVKLLGDERDPVDPEFISNTLHMVPTAAGSNVVPLRPAGAKPRVSQVGSLAPEADFAPSDPDELVAKCQQVSWMVNNQDQVTEPQWHGLAGIAAYCTDPDNTMVAWSNKHPDFNQSQAIAKMHRWKEKSTGPTTCQRMEVLRSGGCRGCAFRKKVNTPAMLSQVYAEPPPVENPDEIPVSSPDFLEVPRPFQRTADNHIVAVIDGVHVKVCDFRIYPTRYGRDDGLGYETVTFVWDRPNVGWQEITLRQAHLNHRNPEFGTAIADQGILLHGSNSQVETFQMLLRAYADQLRRRSTMTNLYTTNGWKNEFNEFVMGNSILRRASDGTVTVEDIKMGTATAHLSGQLWTPAGSARRWRELTQLFKDGHMPITAFMLLMSMGNPLYGYSTGIRGLTINLYSAESGTGKTLTQHFMQSLWGDPNKLHLSGSFTTPGLFNRMAVSGNLPVTVDEGTIIENKSIPNLLYSMSQGVDKLRLTRNATEAELKTWGTLAAFSANKSYVNVLYLNGGNAAQEARLLEFYMPKNPLLVETSDIGRRIYRNLFNHHGFAGPAFVKILMQMGHKAVLARIEKVRAEFPAKYGHQFKGTERYVEQGFIQAAFAAEIAVEHDLIAFDPEPCIIHCLRQLGSALNYTVTMKRDCFDHISEYMNERKAETIGVFYHNNMPTPDASLQPRGPIYVRMELTRDSPQGTKFNRGIAYLDQVNFRRWLDDRGLDWRAIIDDLVANNADKTPPSKRLSMGRHTEYKTPQVYVLGIDLTHSRMIDILHNQDTSRHDTALLTKLVSVK